PGDRARSHDGRAARRFAGERGDHRGGPVDRDLAHEHRLDRDPGTGAGRGLARLRARGARSGAMPPPVTPQLCYFETTARRGGGTDTVTTPPKLGGVTSTLSAIRACRNVSDRSASTAAGDGVATRRRSSAKRYEAARSASDCWTQPTTRKFSPIRALALTTSGPLRTGTNAKLCSRLRSMSRTRRATGTIFS